MIYFLPFSKSEINKLLLKELEFWKKRVKLSMNKILNLDFLFDRLKNNIILILFGIVKLLIV